MADRYVLRIGEPASAPEPLTMTAEPFAAGGTFANAATSYSGGVEPFFEDGFESGDLEHTENGFTWATDTTPGSGSIAVVSGIAYSGDYAMRFRYDGGSAEHRFNLGSSSITEVGFEYMVRIPDNWTHEIAAPGNNKFFALWAGSYSTPGHIQAVIEYERASSTESNPRVICMTEGSGCLNGDVLGPLFTTSMRGTWVRYRIYLRAGLLGAMRVWRDDTLVYTHDTDFIYDGGNNFWRNGYLFGSANADYSQVTDFYVDDFKVYTADPGWWP